MSTDAEVAAALAHAETLCRTRGVRLTAQRREVLELVCREGQPLGAYEVLERLRARAPRTAPITVYRALDFLLRQGFIHKLASLHAYVSCLHPDHAHASQFLICSRCGRVTELLDESVAEHVRRAALDADFRPDETFIEVHGLCTRCTAA